MTMKFSPRVWLGCAVILSGLLLAGYGLVYQFQPFTSFWNDFWTNAFTVLGATFTAVAALLIMSGYDRKDGGFRVWVHFSVGFILWALAEVAWGYLNLKLGEVPTPSWADYLWLAGYVFFSLAFLRQYRLLFAAPRWRDMVTFVGIWLVTLIITRVAQNALGEADNLGSFIDLFYPFADLAVCVMALGIAYTFRRGVMARPWLALFVLGLSDGLYAWLEETGQYSFTLQNGNILTLLVDSTYLLAYLVLGLGLLTQYFVMRYGPWAFRRHKPGAA